MVKKIYLEESVDRASLKAFVQRVFHLSGLHLTVYNERGEAVVGEHERVLGGPVEPADLKSFADGGTMMRPDGTSLKVVNLDWRGHLYGAVLIGPYRAADAGSGPDAAGGPSITGVQLEAVTEMIEHFFTQQAEIASEREALRRKEKILSVLEEASNIMNSTLDFQNLLEFLMDIAIDITGATCGALLLKKDKKRYLEVAVARGAYPQEVKKIRVPIGQGVTGWVAKNREPLVIPNVLLEPRYIETPEAIYSEMAVPLTVGDKLIGVIAVDSSEINAFTKDDCTTLNTLASMVTKVLENARLLSSSNQQVREMSNLFAISEKLSERAGEAELLNEVMTDAAAALACNGMSLMLHNGDRDDLYMAASLGLPGELESLRIPVGKGIHGHVAAQRKAVLITDVTHDVSVVKFSFLDHFSRSVLAVPLATKERLVGVLSAYQKKDVSPFTEADEKLLTTIGRLLTSHFENRRLFDDSRRKLEYLTTLYKVSSSVSKTLNIVRLFNMILQQVQDVMDVENCSLMAYDPLRNQLSLDAAIGMPKQLVGHVFVPVGEGIAGWVAQQKQPVLIRDISKDERFANRSGRLEYTTRSVLSVPILHNKSLLGVLNVNNKRSGSAFTEDDLNLLLSISGQISQAIANANLYERTEQQVAELSLIQELGKAINSSLDLDSVLTYFIDMTTRITESDRATLMLYSEDTQELHVQVSRGFDDERIKDVRFRIGEGIAGQAARQRKPLRVSNTGLEPQFKKLALETGPKAVTLISAPLLNRDNLVGVINCERELDKKGPFTVENLDLLDTLASQASVAIENARLYHNLLNVYLETIRALAAAIDAKDSYTHGHSRRVTDLSVALALTMELPRTEVDTIRHAALLHDVGKIGISEQILLKPGRLTDDEFETIKSHPHIGAGILNSIEFLKNVCLIIEHHHERYDGRGYPSNLKADEIPVGARIIMVADSFDAITSCRPYRKPLTFDEAMAEIGRCAGTQFDPRVVAAFTRLRESPFCPIWLRAASLEEAERNGVTADPSLFVPASLKGR
ncbi:MAG TPA: GAF domain-containing protein [Candidatus Ozemobacteraceae bacterium]|nr:GAF domain-containing protein [Candidatus Ozemobacteraceae bacterium]